MREIHALQKLGMDINVISVWKPASRETNAGIMEEWNGQTCFLLPQSIFSIGRALFLCVARSPKRFVTTAWLAFKIARPGSNGLLKQAFYFAEAMLIAEAVRGKEIGHFHNHFGDHSGIVTMLASKLCDIPYSISFHGPHVFFDGGLGRIKEKVLHAQFVRCISYFCRSQVMLYSESHDISALKIVRCGLELEDYRFEEPRERVERIYCAARLAPEKGFEFLIEAIKIVVEQGFIVELHIIGDGPSRAILEHLAQTIGITEHVHFLGAVDESTKMRELYAADLFVLPSLAEGLPSSITEAMAVGVPVVATNIAGISELVEHGRTGLLVRPSDPHALAEAIKKMIRCHKFRKRAAVRARQKAVKDFDVDKESAKLREYLLRPR